MPHLLASMLAAAALAVAAPAAAQESAVPPAAQVTAEGLGYFVGAWTGTGKDPGTGESFNLVYRVEPALGGSWIAGYGESPEIDLKARDMWGRDPRTGEIMRVIFDGSGSYATIRSPGSTGDTLVLEGESQLKRGPVRVRETIRRLGPGEFEAVWELLQDGKWTTYSVERMKRRTDA